MSRKQTVCLRQRTPATITAYVREGQRQISQTFPVGTAREVMELWGATKRLELRRGLSEPERGTLAADIDRYVRAQGPSEKPGKGATVQQQQAWRRRESCSLQLRPFRQQFGHRARGTITRLELQNFMVKLQNEGYSKSSLNKYRTYFLSMWKFVEGNTTLCPMRDLPRYKEDTPMPGAVGVEVWDALFAVMGDSKAKAHIMLTRYTGARPAEIGWLRPEDVVLEGERPGILYRGAKGCDNRWVPCPVGTKAHEAASYFVQMAAWGRYSSGSAGHAIRRAAKKAGVDMGVRSVTQNGKTRARVHWYAGRHEHFTQLRVHGTDLADVQAIAGHKSSQTTLRYSPTVDAKLVDAMRRVG